MKAEAKARTTMRADRLVQPPHRAPPPKAATPGAWVAQAGPTQVRLAQALAVRAATGEARLSMAYDSGKAKAARMVAAGTVAVRPRRTVERGGARPPIPVHAAAPARCTVFWSVLLVAC